MFVDTLEARLGEDRAAGILDLDLLERNGLERNGPFSRANFERWLAEQALEAVRAGAADSESRTRFPIFVVGALDQSLPRRSGLGLPARIRRALGRITLPRGVEPLPVAIWTLPERWTPLQGAELFAWLKEFTAALGAPDVTSQEFSLSLLLGRSGLHAPEAGDCLSHSDHGLARQAAEFIAACHTTRALDWALAAGRGLHRRGRFYSLGIAPIAQGHTGDDGPWLTARRQSPVLWPTSPPTNAREERVAHGLLGIRHHALTPEALHGWERVPPIDDGADPSRQWLCRLAFGLEPRNLLGAADWREHYLRLPVERRRELHSVADAADWADPLDSPTAVVPEAVMNEPVFPVLSTTVTKRGIDSR